LGKFSQQNITNVDGSQISRDQLVQSIKDGSLKVKINGEEKEIELKADFSMSYFADCINECIVM
jgi:hypothetical protein